MRSVLSVVIVIMSAMVSASAQTEPDRKQYVEDKSVTLRVEKVPAAEREDYFLPCTSYSYPVEDFRPGVVQVGPRNTYLKEGFSTEEVVRLLGKPSAISERSETGVVVTVYEFPRGEGRVLIAEFIKGVLVHSTTETHGQVALRRQNI